MTPVITKKIYLDAIAVSGTARQPLDVINQIRKDNDNYFITEWIPSDCLDTFNRNMKDPSAKQKLISLGFADHKGNPIKNKITYKINSNSFRGDHWDKKPGIVCFGCSYTFGIGVDQHQSWPEVLGQKLKQPVYNLGIPAFGLDAIMHYVLHWMDEDIPHPTAFFVMEPPPGRIVLWRRSHETLSTLRNWLDNNYIKTEQQKLEVIDSLEGTGQVVNLNAIATLKLIAKYKNIPFYFFGNGHHLELDPDRDARDLAHHSSVFLERVADFFANEHDKYTKGVQL